MHRNDCGELSDWIRGWTPNAEISKTVFDHHLRVIEIAAIDDDRIAERLIEALQIQRSELRPVRQDKQSIGIVGRGVRVAYILERRTSGKDLFRTLDRSRIEGGDQATFGEQHLNQLNRWRFSDVVGLPFEGEAQDPDSFATERPEGGPDFAEEASLLLGVDLFHLGEKAEVNPQLFRHSAEGGDVFRKAGAAIADTGTQKLGADTTVQTHAASDLFHVGAGGFTEIGDCVDEGDLQGKEGIGGMLDDLCTFGGGKQQRRGLGEIAGAWNRVRTPVVLATGERRVDCVEDSGGAVAVGTNDDAIGMEEVGDGSAFAEELRIGDDVEQMACDAIAFHGAADPLVGIDRDRALFDDDLVAGKRPCDLAGDRFNVGEVGIAVLALRSANGNKDSLAFTRGFGEIGHEANFGVAVALQEFRKVVLVDKRIAALKGFDFALVIIDTNDVMAHLSETDGSHQADVPRSDNGNLNVFIHSLMVNVLPHEDIRI